MPLKQSKHGLGKQLLIIIIGDEKKKVFFSLYLEVSLTAYIIACKLLLLFLIACINRDLHPYPLQVIVLELESILFSDAYNDFIHHKKTYFE